MRKTRKTTARAKQRQLSGAFTTKCDGLVIKVPGLDKDQKVAARALSLRVASWLDGDWEVDPIGDFDAFTLRPTDKARGRLRISKAWDITYQLRERYEVALAELAVVGPGAISVSDEEIKPLGIGDICRDGPPIKGAKNDEHWSLAECTRIREAWRFIRRKNKPLGKGIVIGHPDTGYTDHPQLDHPKTRSSRLRWNEGYNFVENQQDPVDPLNDDLAPGHGTGTASVIMSGVGNDCPNGQKDVWGAAPESDLIPWRVDSDPIHWRWDNLVRAFARPEASKCHVFSMSLGGLFHSRILESAIHDMTARGAVFLGASGNCWQAVIYPARFADVIAVAACNFNLKSWKHSAHGPTVDIMGPGETVWRAGTETKDDYTVGYGSGTSYAVATVAGVCALWQAFHGRNALIGKYGHANVMPVFKHLLKKTAHRPKGYGPPKYVMGQPQPYPWNDQEFGAGIVDALALMKEPLPDAPPARSPYAIGAFPKADPDETLFLLSELVGDVQLSQLTDMLERAMHVPERYLRESLALYGDELYFHIANDAEFRSRVRQLAAAKKKRKAPGAELLRSPYTSKLMSKALRKRLKGP